MTTQIKSPESTVSVLKAINPTETADNYLTYPVLHDELDAQQKTVAQRWEIFESATPDSVEAQKAAASLAAFYLLQTVAKLNEDGIDKNLWADRFTRASEELYGIEPDNHVWLTLHGHELKVTKHAAKQGNSHAHQLLELYEEIGVSELEATDETAEALPDHRWGEFIAERYADVFSLIKDGETYGAAAMSKLFEASFPRMAEIENDNGWLDWTSPLDNTDRLSVNAEAREINIGKKRALEGSLKMKQLVAHELLVHALRGQRARAAGDARLVKGLSGYLNTEEGMGVLNEAAVSGTMPDKAADRYHDIGLALGLHGGRQITRPELMAIVSLRYQMREPTLDTNEARDRAVAHVNRIFRGGPGGDDPHAHQAVFVKDMTYFTGYHKMTRFINDQLEKGRTTTDLFEYLMQGKFDPTNPLHMKYLAQKNKKANS